MESSNYQQLQVLLPSTSAGGSIVLAQTNTTGKQVVLKKEPKPSNSLHIEQRLLKALSSRGQHPNIIEVRDFIEDADSCTMVLDYMRDGDLFNRVEQQGGLTHSEGKQAFFELASAVQHCHIQGIAHRDVTLENVLITDSGSVVLTDFGLAVESDEGPCTDCCGKELYIAPEAQKCTAAAPYDAIGADVWSLGVCLFTLMCGVPPVEQATMEDERYRILASGKLEAMTKAWGLRERFTDPCMDLALKLLQPDPAQRLGIGEVLAHPWLVDCQQPALRTAIVVARSTPTIMSRPSMSGMVPEQKTSARPDIEVLGVSKRRCDMARPDRSKQICTRQRATSA